MKNIILVLGLASILAGKMAATSVSPEETDEVPESLIRVNLIDTECRALLAFECKGWPVVCGHTREIEYCPLEVERPYLYIDPALEPGDVAYLLNVVYEGKVVSTWLYSVNLYDTLRILVFDSSNSQLVNTVITWRTKETMASSNGEPIQTENWVNHDKKMFE